MADRTLRTFIGGEPVELRGDASLDLVDPDIDVEYAAASGEFETWVETAPPSGSSPCSASRMRRSSAQRSSPTSNEAPVPTVQSFRDDAEALATGMTDAQGAGDAGDATLGTPASVVPDWRTWSEDPCAAGSRPMHPSGTSWSETASSSRSPRRRRRT